MNVQDAIKNKDWDEFVSELATAIADELESRQTDFIKVDEAKKIFNCSGRLVGMMVAQARKIGIECQPQGKGTHIYSRKALKEILRLKKSGEWKRILAQTKE